MEGSPTHRLSELFTRLLSAPPREREELLAAIEADEPDLVGQLRSLLTTRPPRESAGPVGGLERGGGEPSPDDPDRIGPYRLIREIGRGGMGIVYLADRVDGHFRQRVAIKLLMPTEVDDPARQRFLAERQILASLHHPGIARLLDGGIAADGRPYLVLEYVKGVPITTYCDLQRLGVEERLRLFMEVCSAVQHAHQNLVIHRDLKPSNILTSADGRVHLLDFGIAKLLNPGLSAAAPPVTRLDLRLMTPEYASPEQMRGESLSTTSDVYSLGGLLYELLTGSTPHELEGRGLAEALHLVMERDPVRPSDRVMRGEVRQAGEGRVELTPEARSAARGTTVERLHRRLKGDLDSIVLLALRKEPSRRYASADLFRRDIQRYLDGRPVLAHRGDRRYRALKLLKRHRVEAVAGALVLVSLVVGTGVSTWQARVAAQERDRAREALAESEVVTEFLVALFEGSDPTETRGDSITARELLERGADRMSALADRPAVYARMLDAVGRVYVSVGQFDRARALLEEAVRLRRHTLPPSDPDLGRSLYLLGDLLRLRSEYDAAEPLLEESFRLRSRALGDDHPEVALSLERLGRLARDRGEYRLAEQRLRDALDRQRRTLGDDHPDVGRTLDNLAGVYLLTGQYLEAEAISREVLALRRRTLPGDHPWLSEALNNLGFVLRRVGRYDEAEAILVTAIERRRRLTGESVELATGLHNLGSLRVQRGDLDGGERLLRESLDMRRRFLGEEHTSVSVSLNNLGYLMLERGDAPAAERLLRQALAMATRLVGGEHYYVTLSMRGLALALLRQGDPDTAESMLRESLAIQRRLFPADHPEIGETLHALGAVRLARGDLAGAERSFLEAWSILDGKLAPQHGAIRRLRDDLVALFDQTGRPAEARRYRGFAEIR